MKFNNEIFKFNNNIEQYLSTHFGLNLSVKDQILRHQRTKYPGYNTKKDLFFAVSVFDLSLITAAQLKQTLNEYFGIDIIIDRDILNRFEPDFDKFDRELCKKHNFFCVKGNSDLVEIIAPISKRSVEAIIKGAINQYTFDYCLDNLIAEKLEQS